MTNDRDRELLCRLHVMWRQGMDTIDMARALYMPEHEVERELHVMLEMRRVSVNLGGE